MVERLHLFFNALAFFTRLPVPVWVDHSASLRARAIAHGPLLGILVGAVAALVFAAAVWLLPLSVALLFSMVATALLTGALHEDGLADFCDGFGASRDPDRVIEIMHDSRLGTYGALGLISVVLLKFFALYEILAADAPAATTAVTGDTLIFAGGLMICGHSLSRLVAVSFIYTHDYVSVSDSRSAGVTQRMSKGDFAFAAVSGLLPVTVLAGSRPLLLLAMLPAALVWACLARLYQRRLGGYTGDCLGAAQQIAEVAFYLGVCALIGRSLV